MECSQVHLELPGLLYGELDADARQGVESHLASCGECKAEYDSLCLTAARLDEWSGVRSAVSSADVVGMVSSRPLTWREGFRFLPLATGAVAAMVAFGSLVFLGGNVTVREGGFSVSFGMTGSQVVEEYDQMNEYMLVLHEDPKEAAAVDPAQIPELVLEYQAWAGDLAERGRLVAGEKLTDEPGKLLSAPGERVAVVDGSWIGADDILTGFFQIRAVSYDEAIEISRTCPHVKYGKHVELRQIERTE